MARIKPLKTLAYRVYVHSIQNSNSKRARNDSATSTIKGSVNKGSGISQRDAHVRCKFDSNSNSRDSVTKIISKTPVYPIFAQSIYQGQSKCEGSIRRNPTTKRTKWTASDTKKGIEGERCNPRFCQIQSSGSNHRSGKEKSETLISQNLEHPLNEWCCQEVVGGMVVDFSTGCDIDNGLPDRNSFDGFHANILSTGYSRNDPNMLQYPATFSSMRQNSGRVDSMGDGSKGHSDLKIANELKATSKIPEHVNTKEMCQGAEGLSDSVKSSQSSSGEFLCEYCDRTFLYKSQVEIHMLTHTRVRPFQCNICRKSYRSCSHLNVHYRSHSGEKPYICKVCGKAFTRSSNLTVHLCLHSGERPFQCHVCQKTFAQKTSLYSHMKTHSETRPYRCKVCHKAFKKSSQIAPHMRIHTGDRPFLCSVCNHSFSQKAHLQVHMRRHNGEKPYECEVCHKTFRDRSQLKSHFRVHTGEKNYKCKLCTQDFRYLAQLTKHLKSLHADEIPSTGS